MVVVAALLAAAGCTAGDPDVPVVGCPTGGTGTLEVRIFGVPPGQEAYVEVDGATVTAEAGVTLPAGEHTLRPAPVTIFDSPLVREVAVAPETVVCVRADRTETATMTYDLIGTSGMLWVGNEEEAAADLIAFTEGQLRTSGHTMPEMVHVARGRSVSAFDRMGNLWMAGRTADDPPLLRYPWTSVVEGTGPENYDVVLTSSALGPSPAVTALAFDAEGDLWAATADGRLVMFTAGQLTRSGGPAPAVEIRAVEEDAGPVRALAFDADGNLWAAYGSTVVRYDAARLSTSADEPADLVLSLHDPSGQPLPPVGGMAFDRAGDLWTSHTGPRVVRLVAADLTGTGSREATPEVHLDLGDSGPAGGIAFDNSGGLWLVYRTGTVARLSPEQLAGGEDGRVRPETVVESPLLGSGGSVAFFPAPDGLPLYHSLP